MIKKNVQIDNFLQNYTSDEFIKKIFLMCVYHVEMKWFEKNCKDSHILR